MRKLKKKQNAGESSAVPFDEIMSRVDDFYKRYVTSDNYKRLIEEGNYPIDPKRGLYRQYIANEREGFSRGPGLQVDMGPYGVAAAFAGHSMVDRTDKGFFDSMFDPGMSLLSFLSDYEPSDRSIRFDPTVADAENNPTLQEAILAHEYGHMLNIQDMSIDDFYTYTHDMHGMYMPKSIQNELASRSKVGTDKYNKNLDEAVEKRWQEQTNPNREGYNSFVAVVEDMGYNSLEDAKEDWINKERQAILAHDRSPHERRSDVMALRYLADKFNIYKAEDTRPFTMDDLNKLLEQEGVFNQKSKDEKGFSVADRMLQLFNKEDIVWQMNNVAFDPEIADDLPEGSMRAQDGRETPKITVPQQSNLTPEEQLRFDEYINQLERDATQRYFDKAIESSEILPDGTINPDMPAGAELSMSPIDFLLGARTFSPNLFSKAGALDLAINPFIGFRSTGKLALQDEMLFQQLKKINEIGEADMAVKAGYQFNRAKRLGVPQSDKELVKLIEEDPKKAQTFIDNWNTTYGHYSPNRKYIDGEIKVLPGGKTDAVSSKVNFLDNVKLNVARDAESGLDYFHARSRLPGVEAENIQSYVNKLGDDGTTTLYRYGDSPFNYGDKTSGWFSADPFDPLRYADYRSDLLNYKGNVYKIDIDNKFLNEIYRGGPQQGSKFRAGTSFKEFDVPDGLIYLSNVEEIGNLSDYKKYLKTLKQNGGSLPTFQGTDGSNEVTTENVTADNLKQTIESGNFDISQEQKELETHYRSAPERERLRKEHLNATGETLTDTQLDDIVNKNVELIYSTGSKVKGSTQQAPGFTYDPNVAGVLAFVNYQEGTFPLQLNDPDKQTGVYLNPDTPKDPLGLSYTQLPYYNIDGDVIKPKETLLKGTITHELDHLSNNMGIMGSGKYSPNYQQFKDYYNTFFTNASKENPYSPDYEGDKAETEYYTMPQEVKSYKRNLESALQDAGIWNPEEGEFTQEHLNLLNERGFEMPDAPLLEAINPSTEIPKKDENPYTFGDSNISYLDRINEFLVGTNPEQQAIDRVRNKLGSNPRTQKKVKEWLSNEPVQDINAEIAYKLFGSKGTKDINPYNAMQKLGESNNYNAGAYEDWLAERGITKRSEEELAELKRNQPNKYHSPYSDEMYDKFVNEVFPTIDRNAYVNYDKERDEWNDSAPKGFGNTPDTALSTFMQKIGSKTIKQRNKFLKRFNKDNDTDYKTFYELANKEGYTAHSRDNLPDERNPGLITEIQNDFMNVTRKKFTGINSNRNYDPAAFISDQKNIARLIPGNTHFNNKDISENASYDDGKSLQFLEEQGFNLNPNKLREDAFNNLPEYQRKALEWFANIGEDGNIVPRELNSATIRKSKFKDNYIDLGDDAAPDYIISSISHAINNIQSYIANEIDSQKRLFEGNNRIEQNRIDQKFNIEKEKYKEQQKKIDNNVIKFMNEVAMDEQEQSLTLAKNGGAIEQEIIYKNGKPEFKIIFANGAELKINKEEYDKEINPFYKVSKRKASKGLEFGSPLIIRGKLKLLKK